MSSRCDIIEFQAVVRAEPMRMTDLEQILAIERVSFPAPWSRKIFEDELANRHSRAVVFRIGRRIVGYMCFWLVLDEAHLLNIAVHPDLRKSGHGKAMMDYLENCCRREGLKRIILDVARRNLAARNLYGKCGYQSIGFRKNYYTEAKDDALVMEKWIGTPEEKEDQPET